MIDRRTLLQAAPLALAGPALTGVARAQGSFDWKQFKGQEIVVSLTKNPRADNLQKHQAEFEALTGIQGGFRAIARAAATHQGDPGTVHRAAKL